MDQKIEPLSDEWLVHMQKQRDWVKGHFTDGADEKYEPLDGKLRLLDTIIRGKWIEPTETWKLQALGIAFGDALVQKLGMEWAEVTDEWGNAPTVRFPQTSMLCNAWTVISKRVEDDEEIDIYDLFDTFCDRLQMLKAEGHH